MSKKAKIKKQGVRELLQLLGADPNEAIPSGLREAQQHAEREGGLPERSALLRCEVSGKVRFNSESQAKGAARARLNRGANVDKLRTFRCPDCKDWHFSSSFFRK